MTHISTDANTVGCQCRMTHISTDANTVGCQCESCVANGPHQSDCAVHNPPAYPAGPCDCGRNT